MYQPAPQSTATIVVRVVTGVVGAAAAAFWGLLAYLVISSRFATNPATDPHGYGLIFGTLLAVPVGLMWAVTLPFAFPRPRWPHAAAVLTPVYLLGTVLLFTAWFTA